MPVDLRELAIRREPPPEQGTGRLRSGRYGRHWLTRYFLPALILLGFVALAVWAARDLLLPVKPVTVVPVVATRSEVQQEGAVLFQAAGWVEPRPTPVLATALSEGVVERLLVVEGQEVHEGDSLARMIDTDARLEVQSKEAEVLLREAELDTARAALTAAESNAATLILLKTALAEAEAGLARSRGELEQLPAQQKAATARRELAEINYERKKSAGDSIAGVIVQQAKAEWDIARAAVEELLRKEPRLKEEVAAMERRKESAQERLQLKIEEQRLLAEAQANVKAAQARLAQSRSALEAAKLRLNRMTVNVPTSDRYLGWAATLSALELCGAPSMSPGCHLIRSGLHAVLQDHGYRERTRYRVLALVAKPGTRVNFSNGSTPYDASTIVTLYDPAALQVRADVRLEDLPRVQPGQRVRIETPAVKGQPLEGTVLFLTSLADIQKNTLQIKVAIHSPPAVLRADMLVLVTFLALPTYTSAKPEQSLRVLIPRQLVESADGDAHVWVADRTDGTARLRTVKLGKAEGEMIEALEGLAVGDKLISGGREGLRDGQRIKITGEDDTLGVPPRGTRPSSKTLDRLLPAGKKEHH